MGWTCQYDFKGRCKLLKKDCEPGTKGCILNSSEYTFSTGSYEEDKKAKDRKQEESIDFELLARSN